MVAKQLRAVIDRANAAAQQVGRDPADVTLVAVTKGQSVATIMEAYDAGHRDFGENRAAELAEKAPQLPDDIRWHFIGTLQTRQAKLAAPHTHLLHSVDRARLINTWSGAAAPSPVLLQVNVAGEAQKHGVEPENLATLASQAQDAGLDCVGLMCIPPLAAGPEDNRPWFVRLRELRNELQVRFGAVAELSMGMTDDFEVAIEEGATLIRVGRAIFGAPGVPARND